MKPNKRTDKTPEDILKEAVPRAIETLIKLAREAKSPTVRRDAMRTLRRHKIDPETGQR